MTFNSRAKPKPNHKRACDRCRLQRKKCKDTFITSCQRCTNAGATCTFDNIPKKEGPKLQIEQQNAQPAAEFPTYHGLHGRSLSSTFARTPGLMSHTLVESCIEHFFTYVHPSETDLYRQTVKEAVGGMDRSTEAYCMVVALCAYVMIQANDKPPINVPPLLEMVDMSNVDIGNVLLNESIYVRQGYDYREKPTPISVLTSCFYTGCYSGLAREYMTGTPPTYVNGLLLNNSSQSAARSHSSVEILQPNPYRLTEPPVNANHETLFENPVASPYDLTGSFGNSYQQ